MLEVSCAKPPPTLDLSFSSLSVAPTEKSPRALYQTYVSEKTVANMGWLHELLSPIADVSISLHVGDMIDVPDAARQLGKRGVRITSLDRPDVYATKAAVKDVLLQLKEGQTNEAVITAARRVHNVGTEEGANKKIHQGVEALKRQETYDGSRIILRTHAGLWVQDDGATGERLRKLLKGTGVVIAVEIFAAIQTQSEYRQFIKRLAKENAYETEIYYDLDLGHIAEAKYRHADHSDGKDPVAFLEDVIQESGGLVAVTSLNQYRDGDHLTHRHFLDPMGIVQHQSVARALGKGVRTERLDPHVITVVESTPFEFPQILSEKGVIFVRDFKRQFEESAGK